MADPDVCLQQLQAANTEIANTDQLNKGIDATRARLNKEYEDSNAIYLQKVKDQARAQQDVDNMKNSETKHVNCDDGCGWGKWSDGECNGHCQKHVGRYSDGVNIKGRTEYEQGCCYSKRYSCSCFMPELGEYNRRVTVRNTKKKETEDAERDKNARKKSWEESLAMIYKTANINIACCQNSLTCAPGADCADITQNCEAKISSLKEDKAAKEAADKEAADAKEVADKEAADAKALADKEADAKAAAQKNNPSSVGQAKTNSIGSAGSAGSTGSTGSSSNNTTLIGIGGLVCCCFLIIIVIIMMK
jgi:hypothetical protein